MQLILLSNVRGPVSQLRLTSFRAWLGIATVVLGLGAGTFYAGFQVAGMVGAANPAQSVVTLRTDLAEQESVLQATRRTLQQNVDALALKLGQMNAQMVRLEALGSRLTRIAGFDDGEFDFSAPPSLGGPEQPLAVADEVQIGGIVSTLDALDQQLADRGRQLGVLEDFLLDRKLQGEVLPEGRPVSGGYISSGFGNRTDPFTGRRAFHQGVDFAGRPGADVIAVASGVVIWSGPRLGYGELVEINHGNGYVTRYAHNADNLVAVGDTVKRGHVIARVGRTGRATGPNLHFEVLRNGLPVNPLTYIRAKQ